MSTSSQIAECSLSYAKIMQTSAMRACSLIAECSLSYAKIKDFCCPDKSWAVFLLPSQAREEGDSHRGGKLKGGIGRTSVPGVLPEAFGLRLAKHKNLVAA